MTRATPAHGTGHDASALEGLAGDAATALAAIRRVKNQVIGNRAQKLAYVRQGVVPRVVRLLAAPHSGETRVQAAAALASLGYRSLEGAAQVMASRGVEALLQVLPCGDAKVTVAACRALKMLFQVLSRRACRSPRDRTPSALVTHPTLTRSRPSRPCSR